MVLDRSDLRFRFFSKLIQQTRSPRCLSTSIFMNEVPLGSAMMWYCRILVNRDPSTPMFHNLARTITLSRSATFPLMVKAKSFRLNSHPLELGDAIFNELFHII